MLEKRTLRAMSVQQIFSLFDPKLEIQKTNKGLYLQLNTELARRQFKKDRKAKRVKQT